MFTMSIGGVKSKRDDSVWTSVTTAATNVVRLVGGTVAIPIGDTFPPSAHRERAGSLSRAV